MKNYEAEVLSATKYRLGESPFYDARSGNLSFVDIIAGNFYFFSEKDIPKVKDIQGVPFGQQIGAAVPSDDNGYIVAGTDGLYKYKGKEISKARTLTDVYESYQRSNDAKADPEGRLWFGSVSGDDDHEASGNLYRLDHSGIKIMEHNTKISNGMAWNAEKNRFFFSDSPFKAVFAYDYNNETGDISGRKILFEIEDGVPDGMCIDSEDNLWLAVWGGSRIEKRSSITGELLAVVNVPAKNTTSCCFYGKDLDRLFITSSGEGLTGEYDGCIFTCKVDEKGCLPDLVKFQQV